LKNAGVFFRTFLTFFVVIIGWVIFRIEEFDQAMIFYKRMFSFDFDVVVWQKYIPFLITLVFAVFFSFFTAFKKGKISCDRVFAESYTTRMKIVFLFVCVILLALSIGSITSSGFNPFIYFRF